MSPLHNDGYGHQKTTRSSQLPRIERNVAAVAIEREGAYEQHNEANQAANMIGRRVA